MIDLVPIGISLIPSIIMFSVWVWSWTHPPIWMDKSLKDLREWAPRLIGSVKWGTTAQTTQKAKEQGGLVELLATLGEISPFLENIPQLLKTAQNMGLFNQTTGESGGKGVAQTTPTQAGTW